MMYDKNELQTREVRDENIVWTINKDYSFVPQTTLVPKTGIDALDHYRMILFALLHQLEESNSILNYWEKKRAATKKAEIFSELMMITLEVLLHKKAKEDFFGVIEIEKQAIYETLLRYDKMRKRKDVFHEVRYAYYMSKSGSVPKTNSRVVDLIEDIFKFEKIPSSEFIFSLDNLLKKHFYFEKTAEIEMIRENANNSGEESANRSNKAGEGKQLVFLNPLEEAQEVMSAEFNQTDIGKVLQLMEKDHAENPMDHPTRDEGRMYQAIVERYGEPMIFGNRLSQLEKELSVDLHEGQKLHITDRFMNIKGYKKQMLSDQTKENIDHFDYMNKIYRRNITRLTERLNRTILQDTDYSSSKLDNGMIMSGRIWRRAILGDNKVFYKRFRDSRGEFAVDILLDASGSQMERQSLVAAQAYVIAQALGQVNIPCRVSSFNNLFDYTVIKIYRDYKDAQSKNKQIFGYQAEGSNRDGMAIATVGKLLSDREEGHKILIVLSDGKPNDERAGGVFNSSSSVTKAYTGDIAINDTARQVRLLRAKGITVLGVFTGDDEDLNAERKIFGKDFAYINKIEYFSEIVGIYLKRQIQNVLEN